MQNMKRTVEQILNELVRKEKERDRRRKKLGTEMLVALAADMSGPTVPVDDLDTELKLVGARLIESRYGRK